MHTYASDPTTVLCEAQHLNIICMMTIHHMLHVYRPVNHTSSIMRVHHIDRVGHSWVAVSSHACSCNPPGVTPAALQFNNSTVTFGEQTQTATFPFRHIPFHSPVHSATHHDWAPVHPPSPGNSGQPDRHVGYRATTTCSYTCTGRRSCWTIWFKSSDVRTSQCPARRHAALA